MEVKNVKGTRDIFGKDSTSFQYVESVMKAVAELYGFDEMRPPVLEHSEVFVRGVGEGSDVVRKEMYTFLDKGGRSLTLRPEFTAGIIRTIVQNKLYATADLPIKQYYSGPVFRYERPQLGRYRQFNQFGVELVGANNPTLDVEVIVLGYTILATLGFTDVTLKINTLGDNKSREDYKAALKDFFSQHIENMCPDCKSRYELNPLRILDCKVKEDQEIVRHAPKINEYLSEEAQERFEKVCRSLELLEIPFEVDDTLVRGLDYYSETVFEFHYTSKKGQNYGAIGAGGHYDKLVSEFGGPDMHGVGFSFGIERVVNVMSDDEILPDNPNPLINYLIPLTEDENDAALMIATALRVAGYRTEICLDGTKLGTMIKKAVKKNAKFAIIIGESELEQNSVLVKNLSTSEQELVGAGDLIEYIDSILESEKHECECCGDDCDCDCDGDHEHCCCGHHHKKED